MIRAQEEIIRHDLDTRIVLLSGPRQVGKTTLSKRLFERYDYLNQDLAEHRLAIRERSWDRAKDLVILDELHKMRAWKSWLKGVWDVEGARPRLLVTGSSRLDVARRMGESLAGRFFLHRLHPFDLKELLGQLPTDEAFETLMAVGGFPEPFLDGTTRFHGRWRRSHLDIILRQDLIDLDAIRDIQSVETLVEMLRVRVGSTVSMSGMARDLQRDPKTIKRYLDLLENLHVVFKVTPYHKSVPRSLLKEPKFYFHDVALVPDLGARLENLVACALRKELDRLEDGAGTRTGLHYLRTKDGRELGFAVAMEGRVTHLIEVKTADEVPTRAFEHFSAFMPRVSKIQLVSSLKREKTYPGGTEVRGLAPWLASLELGRG
ncbi:MAG: ATP-binding protein [Polyangia bacterium]|nr:ATP-binding protein [Polyangia bacterium]